jgi:hypothetical protein
MTSKNYKVNIHKLLDNISHDRRDRIDQYSDEDLKSVSPYVLLMWIMGADNNLDIRAVLTDEFVNQYTFALANRKKLLLKLLCVSNGYKIDTRYRFRNPQKQKQSYLVSLVAKYHKVPEKRAQEDMRIYDADDFREMGVELGLDKDEVKKLETAITKHFG